MKIGAVFPQTEMGGDVGAIRAYVEAVQELRFDHLLAYDHVVGADTAVHTEWKGPYRLQDSFQEPLTFYAWLTAVAPKLELVTGVIILPQRQTVLVAKQAAQIDLLSGGRFRLGVGIGWNAVEYEALGMGFTDRGARFEEQIALLRRLWSEPSVTFEGRWHHVTGAGLNPLPVQRPIPIWIGGSAEKALRRAAEVADGFFPQVPLEGGWKVTLDKMRTWREAAGRDPKKFGIEARLNAATGNADEWRARAQEWRELGATHISVNTMGAGFRGTDQHIKRLEEVLEAVRPSPR
jgi:probable F420-dependent oxidoreductase